MVGNGIMDYSDDRLEKSQLNYMFTRNFIDPMLDRYWDGSCQTDPSSAGCKFFFTRYDELLKKVNFHNIYGNCSNKSVSKTKRKRVNGNNNISSFQDKKP